MAVKEELRPILDLVEAAAVPRSEQTPEQMREAFAALSGMGAVEEVASVEDRVLPGPGGDLPVRVYDSRDPGPRTTAGAPGLVWFHGGGWVIGSVETHDNVCRALANSTGAVVVSVDYRLAPEHPFPAALDDALAAVRWIVAHAAELGVDPGRLAVGGDSAGGNLAAVVGQRLHPAEVRLAFQLLVYPLLDARFQTPSTRENAEGYFLTTEALHWFREHYLGDGDRTDVRVSPACAPDRDLAGIPPGLVITAEYDPLRDEGEDYARRARAAGADVSVTRYDGMIHGFFSMGDVVADGRAAIEEAAGALRTALS